MKTITTKWLRENEACDEQVELVEKLFGQEVELTQENWDKAIENRVEVEWLVDYLSLCQRQEYFEKIKPDEEEYALSYNLALEEYEKVVQPPRADYVRIVFSDEDAEIKRLAYVEYQKIQQPAWNVFNTANISTSDELNRKNNQTLFDVLTKED